jgi:hypothetical protein
MLCRYASFTLLIFGLGTLLPWSAAVQDNRDAAPDEGVEVQVRGPVHEAFAEPVEARPQPSIIVTKQPPDPIDELPPDQKPEGDDVEWIPGYWSWDDDTKDFLWVSGFWRDVPPGQQWVPGYWQEVEGGWQWVPGYWAPADQQELTYVPPPPPSVDEGPSTPAPDEDSSYVPGCWIYRDARFWWRPGFWMAFRPGWVWVPAHYCYTPVGYVFVDGYWDFPLHERGLLFSPVSFDRRVLARRDFLFMPRYVVPVDSLLTALFVRPSAYHYYFGDYFEDAYARRGFVSWIDYGSGRRTFDPNFAYYRHAEGRPWERSLSDLYVARRRGDIPRPPRTLAEQEKFARNIGAERIQNAAVLKNLNLTGSQLVNVVAPVTAVANKPVASIVARPRGEGAAAERNVFRLQTVPRDQRLQAQRRAKQFHAVARERQQVDAKLLSEGGAPRRPTDRARTVKLALPGSRTAPAERRPQETQPGERPRETRPGERPRETRPGERPGETRPGERQPPAPRPGERPRETRPGERPAPVPPSGERPRETRPGERQPPPPKPGERPRETRPGERQPPAPRPSERPPQTKPGERAPQPRPGESRLTPRQPPPLPKVPQHEARPVPKHEPPPEVRPPRQTQPQPQRRETQPPPSRREPPAPVRGRPL